MPLSDLTSREAVVDAMREFDSLGREAFLKKYDFGEAREYFLREKNRLYDSKSIVGVAYGLQYPTLGPLRASDFSGGEASVKKALERLGFTVIAPRGPGERKYFILAASPSRYRVREAVAQREVDHWLITRGGVKEGDRVAIWQTRDKNGKRGIVALGEVIGNVELRSDLDNSYWAAGDEGAAEQPRAPVRYHRIPNPLWVDDTAIGQFLRELSIARAQGGTVFRMTSDQWDRVCELVGGFPDGDDEIAQAEEVIRRPGGGLGRQGFLNSLEKRRAIEHHAMASAVIYFEQCWPIVKDVSAGSSYDLLCQNGDQQLRVEVKGTTSSGDEVILTRREVIEAGMPGYTLFVFSDIKLHEVDGLMFASGGRARLITTWNAARHDLVPIAYNARLDWTEGIEIDLPHILPPHGSLR
jgi:hypothetical protein